MKKNKRNRFIIITSLLVLFLGGGGVIFFLVQKQKNQTTENSSASSPTKNNNPKDQPVDNPGSDNPKKILAQQIKEDLQKDLEKVQKGNTSHHLTYINRPWDGCGVPQGEEGFIVLVFSDAPENKGKRDSIAPSELEKEDYEEIVNLIKQVNATREKVTEQKRQEEGAKIDQKLKSNPKMFFYEYKDELWGVPDEVCYFLLGCGEDGKKYSLMVPEKHSAVTNFPNRQELYEQNKLFCLIEGAENIPFSQHPKLPKSPNRFEKWVKLEDKITITPTNS